MVYNYHAKNHENDSQDMTKMGVKLNTLGINLDILWAITVMHKGKKVTKMVFEIWLKWWKCKLLTSKS